MARFELDRIFPGKRRAKRSPSVTFLRAISNDGDFPDVSGSGMNFWVDVAFTPSASPGVPTSSAAPAAASTSSTRSTSAAGLSGYLVAPSTTPATAGPSSFAGGSHAWLEQRECPSRGKYGQKSSKSVARRHADVTPQPATANCGSIDLAIGFSVEAADSEDRTVPTARSRSRPVYQSSFLVRSARMASSMSRPPPREPRWPHRSGAGRCPLRRGDSSTTSVGPRRRRTHALSQHPENLACHPLAAIRRALVVPRPDHRRRAQRLAEAGAAGSGSSRWKSGGC